MTSAASQVTAEAERRDPLSPQFLSPLKPTPQEATGTFPLPYSSDRNDLENTCWLNQTKEGILKNLSKMETRKLKKQYQKYTATKELARRL